MGIWVFRLVMLGFVIILSYYGSQNDDPCAPYQPHHAAPDMTCEVISFQPVYTCEGPEGFGSPC